MMETFETDVLVVGAGPTGLMTTLLLAANDVKTLTISRHPGTAPEPRATHTNQRTVEVLRDVGLESLCRSVGKPLAAFGNNVIVTSLAGREVSRYRSYGAGDRASDYFAASPCVGYHIPQHHFERELLGAALQRGADVRFFRELIEITQSDDSVLARVRDRRSDTEYMVRAKYAVGADGSRSRVAEQLGVVFEGQTALKHMVNAWFEADLADYTAYRPAILYTVVQPGSPSVVGAGTFICVEPWKEWVLVREYDPATGVLDTSAEAVVTAVRTLVGDPTLDVTVKTMSTWQVNHLVAQQYRVGRVFLAGDAAHRHPPAGGLGANTGMQDAWNLAWKLGLVISGVAGDELLDSYDQERQPVGKQVVDRAITLLMNQGRPMEALGLRRGQSAEEGWAALNELASDTPAAEGRRQRLSAATTLQYHRSNANGVELGQRYTSRAVIDDGTPFPQHTRDPELYYHPTTHPGGYLPHAWLEHDRSQISTLDLAGHGRFCLIVGIGGRAWADAAADVDAEFGIELPVYRIGYRCEYDDVYGDWERLREISDHGALLVRPDRVIAWRAAEAVSEPKQRLRAALRAVLSAGEGRGQYIPSPRHQRTASATDQLATPRRE